MAPRTLISRTASLAFRSKTSLPRNKFVPYLQQNRFASNQDESKPLAEDGTKGPNMEQLPHISEETAAIDKTMGQTPPDLEQGTPVQEILERDKESQKNAPQVLKDEMKNGGPGTGQKRSFSTSVRRRSLEVVNAQSTPAPPPMIVNGMIQGVSYPDAGPGHKFPLPDMKNMSPLDHLKRRYDPVVDQVTKMIMTHGKLSQAQSNMTHILNTLRTAPPPQPNIAVPGRGLLLSEGSNTLTTSGANISVPRTALPLHPVEYLTTVVDSVAPLLKIRQQRGIAGGGASLPIPVPLGIRQRRRQAIKWIINAADNRREEHLADRVAKEIINVAEGKSSVWERRAMQHRLGMSARSNVKMIGAKTKKRFSK